MRELINSLVQGNCPQNRPTRPEPILYLSLAFSNLKLYHFVLISAAELFAGSSGKWVRCFVLPTLVFDLIVILRLLLLVLLPNSWSGSSIGPPCHVLILTPLSECLMTESLTVMLETHAREFRMPWLPILHPLKRIKFQQKLAQSRDYE